MRRLLVLIATAGVLGLPLPGAHASCVGPQLSVEGVVPTYLPGHVAQVRLAPGQAVDVVGEAFFAGCDDVGGGDGDGGCDDDAPGERMLPRRDVALDLVVGGHGRRLGRADADDAFVVRWSVRVPAGLPPGPAVLGAGGARLDVVITAPR
ncbi:MAG: hypothetical protein JWM64_87 [Frankiales bacterium]|nr:hypothetical protein [Frankiales bacterium]